jgi:transglutaminase-like putative cysteine protease
MKVRAAAPDYWRGTSYDSWDGRTWSRSPLPDGVDDPNAGGVSADVPIERQNLVQVFTVVSGGSDLLFGAYRAVQHVSPDGRSHTQSDGTTTVPRVLGPGARYAVVSSRPVVDADLLRRADPLGGPLPSGVRARYLALPSRSPTRAVELARQVTDSQPTTYDKIRALERWIGDHTTYTLDIPPLPAGADAVDQFLFVDRKGYCEQIATSLAVMLRGIGVPARLGVGYVPGQRSWARDEFVVRSRDAHAWVEVWFPGVGWQAFDPTASVPMSGDSSPSTRARVVPWLVGAAASVVLAGLGVFGVRSIRRRRAITWEKHVLDRLERLGAQRGRRRSPSETATEYARALGEGPLADPRLYEVGVALSRAAYGPDQLDPAERRRIDRLLDEIAENAPPPARRRARATAGR